MRGYGHPGSETGVFFCVSPLYIAQSCGQETLSLLIHLSKRTIGSKSPAINRFEKYRKTLWYQPQVQIRLVLCSLVVGRSPLWNQVTDNWEKKLSKDIGLTYLSKIHKNPPVSAKVTKTAQKVRTKVQPGCNNWDLTCSHLFHRNVEQAKQIRESIHQKSR